MTEFTAAKLKTGAIWTGLGAMLSALAQALAMIFVGVFLTPLDLGYFAIAIFIIGLLTNVSPLGNDYAVVMHDSLSASDFNRLVFQSGALFFGLGLLVWVVYGTIVEPLVRVPSSIVVAAIFVGTLEGGHQMVNGALQRKLNYKRIEQINVLKHTLFLTLSMSALVISLDVLLLILCRGAAAIVAVVCAWVASGATFDTGDTAVPRTTPLGRDMLAKNCINYLSKNAEIYATAPQIGIAGVGYYDFSRRIVGQPRDLLASVLFKFAFPVLAKFQKLQTPHVRNRLLVSFYGETVAVAALVGFPMFTIMMLIAPALILHFMGQEWGPAIGVFQVFAATALLQLLGNGLITASLTAIGYSRVVMKTELFTLPLRIAVIFIASFFGLVAVAVTSCLFIVAKLLFLQHVLIRQSALSYALLWRRIRPMAGVTILALFPATVPFVTELDLMPATLLSGTVFGMSYCIFSFIFMRSFLFRLMAIRRGASDGAPHVA